MALLGFFFQLPVSLEFHRVVDYSNSIPQNSILDFKSKFIEIIERMGQTYVFFVTYQQVEQKYELNYIKIIMDHQRTYY